MSHVLQIGVADQIAYFRVYNTDGSAKTDFTHATAGAALTVFRVGLTPISITTLSSKAADDTAHSDGAIRQVAGNLYTIDLPDTATALQTPSIGIRGSFTGGVIEPVPHPIVNYNPATAAIGALTSLGTNAPAAWINNAAIADGAITNTKVSNITVASVSGSVTVGGYEAGQSPSTLVDLTGIPSAILSTIVPGSFPWNSVGHRIGECVDASIAGVPAGVWGHVSRALTSSVTVGGYAAGQSPATLVNLTGIPASVWSHSSRTLSAFAFDVTVGGYAAGQSPATLVDLSGIPNAVLATIVPGSFAANTVGHRIGTFIDAAISGVSGGGGTADWTANERTAIRAILGIPVSGTTPTDPSMGILDTIRDAVAGVPAGVWGHGARSLTSSVTVGGYDSGQSPASQLNVSSLAAKTDLPSNFALLAISGSGQVSASNVSVIVNPTSLNPASVAAIQDPILAAIAVITQGAADYAIRVEVKYQGNGVANAKVALAGTTAAAFTDSNGFAQLNVSANATYNVRLTPPDGYQFVADFAVQVLTADVTVPITLAANSLPSVVPPLRVTYDEIRRHVGRFLGFGASPDRFEASQLLAVDDTIRQGLRDVYFPSINGAPYEWSFLKRYTELQFSGGSTFALPTSFVRLASQLTVPGLGYPLRQVSESALRSMAVDSTEQGPPIYYALSADGDSLDLGVTLYQIRLFPVPPAGGHAEFWYHISPEIDLNEGGPLGGIDLASTIIECCLARAELAQNVESISQGGGIHMARSQEMLRRSIEADRALQSATLAVSMADQMRPPQ